MSTDSGERKPCAIFITILLLSWNLLFAQTFHAEQQQFRRVRAARINTETARTTLFQEAGINNPPKQMFIRVFKLERVLELWACNSDSQQFKLIKSYPLTAYSGTLGPKRQQGDYQIPEGVYFISGFNPASSFHLSMRVNYPNKSDLIRKTGSDPGGDIFIHGNKVTIGCIPIGDGGIEELYIIAVDTKSAGQEKIPVHIFPYRMDLTRYIEEYPDLKDFWDELRPVYDAFENTRRIPSIRIDESGRYRINP